MTKFPVKNEFDNQGEETVNDESKKENNPKEVSTQQKFRLLNARFKKKRKEILEKQASLFEVEPKLIEINRKTLRTEFGLKNKRKKRNGERENKSSEEPSGGEKSDETPPENRDSSTSDEKQTFPPRITKEATKTLREWFLEHSSYPYPE